MTEVGSVYGQALYSLAKEEGISREILAELKSLHQGFSQTPEFLKLLCAANLPKEERCRILDDSFRGKIHPYVLNFLKILTEKGYARRFSQCLEAYQDAYRQDNGILPVFAVTAVPLTPEQAERLSRKLSERTGKTIELENRIDPEVLGGVRLDYDGKRLDDTLANRLERIGTLLKNTVL